MTGSTSSPHITPTPRWDGMGWDAASADIKEGVRCWLEVRLSYLLDVCTVCGGGRVGVIFSIRGERPLSRKRGRDVS